jgi:hypothetical protein
MAAIEDVDQLIEQYDLALGEFYRGDPEPLQKLWSHREDVTLAPPFGPPAHGWDEVAASMERGASQFRDGEMVSFELIEKCVIPFQVIDVITPRWPASTRRSRSNFVNDSALASSVRALW